MSRRLQDIFWDIDLTSTEQLVAQRLAWHADDATGECWPGIANLCAKTGLGARAIGMAIKGLAAAGHITRRERVGVGCLYIIHPRTKCAGGAPATVPTAVDPFPATHALDARVGSDEPPHQMLPRTTCTPAPDAATPARRARKQVKNPSNEKHEGAGADDATPEQKITGQRGKRIDVNWQPTKALPERVAKVTDSWPPGRLTDVLDEFRAYWLAEAGKIASKLDWDLTWHNRLRAVIAHDARHTEREQRRNGNRPHHDRRSGWAARPGMEGAEPAYLAD